MVFSSITFLLYFLPVAILGYYMFSFSRVVQNIWLLVISLIFYAWGEPVFVFVMIGSIIANWIFGLLVHVGRNKKKFKKVVLIISVIANVSVLALFKYTNFIVDTFYDLTGWKQLLEVPDIALPIGISFFTFQAMSYVIDVYRKDAEVQKNPFYLGLYIAFFPQLVAGPIVRYQTIANQIKNRKTTFEQFSDGTCRFAVGLVKKIIISNNMAVIADTVFDLATAGSDTIQVPVLLAWMGAIAYILQLYYDFSSYSDMAIGLGKMFGFTFEENFNYPFVGKSVREFMGRWHISLTSWFMSYVYFPLGGSRVSNEDIMVRNLLVVWLLSGIWHGAAWTYIWWGLMLFIFMVIEKVTMMEKWQGFKITRHVYTIIAMIIAFTMFRAESVWHFAEMLRNMFWLNDNGFYSPRVVMFIKEYWPVIIAAVIFVFPVSRWVKTKISEKKVPAVAVGIGQTVYVAGLLALMCYCVIVLAKGGYNPFIYFNF